METKDNARFHIILVEGWVQKDGKFLLAQRSMQELQAPGRWSLPGGKVEGEVGTGVLQKDLKKEILEEVGIEISDDMELLSNGAFTRVDGSHVVSLTFLCSYASGEATALEDTAAVRWFTLDELKKFDAAEDFLKRKIQILAKWIQKDPG